MKTWTRCLPVLAALTIAPSLHAKVPPAEADQLGKTLTPLGGDKAANKDGSIPAWDGGWTMARPAAGKERDPAAYPLISNDKPLFTVTPANFAQYKDQLTPGHAELMKRYPTYKLNVYPSRRTTVVPDYINEATKQNALTAELENDGEDLINAAIGIPFPLPKSGIELMWNHKTRYRGQSLIRYNTQLPVQTTGEFLPHKLSEAVRYHYNLPGQTALDMGNVITYLLQVSIAPEPKARRLQVIYETKAYIQGLDRALEYSAGRVVPARHVSYDNPAAGAQGLRTYDQRDAFSGPTDRYTWKLMGKKEMIVPYNAVQLFDDGLKYSDIAKKGHLNQDLARYEKHRVWVVDSTLKPGISHIYSRRTFYIDEDSHSIVAVDCYDKDGVLWRVQEAHGLNLPWMKANVPVASTVYDLRLGRYLVMDLSNEEPLLQEGVLQVGYFGRGNIVRLATQ